MKKIIIFIVAILSLPIASSAVNELTLNITRNSDNQWTLVVALTNEKLANGIQLDLVMPDQFNPTTESITKASRMTNINVQANTLESGNLRIVGYASTRNRSIVGRSGDLFSITLTASNTLPEGTYNIAAKNIRLSNTNTGETIVPGTSIQFDVANINYHTLNFWNGEQLFKTYSLASGDSIPTIEEPSAKEGFTFCGWGDVPEVMPDEDLDLYATWCKQSFTITYLLNGETTHTEIVAYGDSLPSYVPEAPEGYSFKGWKDAPLTMPADNITLEPEWSINTYNIEYYLNDSLVYTQSVTYNEEFELYNYNNIEEAQKYVFVKWAGDTYDKMPAHNIRYDAIAALLGDVNMDGVTNAGDAVSIYNYIINGDASGIYKICADVNGDGNVNAADVTELYNLITYGSTLKSIEYRKALSTMFK